MNNDNHTHYHIGGGIGCFSMLFLAPEILFVLLFVMFVIITPSCMTIGNVIQTSTEQKQETKRAKMFFSTMKEVEKIRSERDKKIEKMRTERDKKVAYYEMVAKIKSSFANSINHFFNLGFAVFLITSIWLIAGYFFVTRKKE